MEATHFIRIGTQALFRPLVNTEQKLVVQLWISDGGDVSAADMQQGALLESSHRAACDFKAVIYSSLPHVSYIGCARVQKHFPERVREMHLRGSSFSRIYEIFNLKRSHEKFSFNYCESTEANISRPWS